MLYLTIITTHLPTNPLPPRTMTFVPAGAALGVPLANALSGAEPATATPSTPAVRKGERQAVKRVIGRYVPQEARSGENTGMHVAFTLVVWEKKQARKSHNVPQGIPVREARALIVRMLPSRRSKSYKYAQSVSDNLPTQRAGTPAQLIHAQILKGC